MTRPTPQRGDLLGGRYTLTDHIAAGGMGDVWKGTDAVLGRTVAVKVMRPRTDEEATFAARFRDEGQHAARLQHPNIATVFDFGEDDGLAYLVMEYVPGVPLSELIARGPLATARAQHLLGQCALALASAHEAGVVHRDVKPANILVTPEGQVKLTDFGIARAVDGVGHTRTGEVMGTPQYLAPEQAQGRPVTGATDLYSLGVVGFEMVTGVRPFDAGSPVATALAHINEPAPPLPDRVTDPLRAAIESCLAKKPLDRPSSAASLAALLGMPVSGVASASPATSVIAPGFGPDSPPPPALATPPAPPAPPARVAPAAPVAPSTQVLPSADLYAADPYAGAPGGDRYAGAPSDPYAVARPGYGPPAAYQQGYGYPPAQPEPAQRRSSAWWWLLPIVVLAAVVAFLASQGVFAPAAPAPAPTTSPRPTSSAAPATPSPTTTTTITTTTSRPTVTIKATDYIGKQVDVVRAAIQSLDPALRFRTDTVASDRPAGTVLNVFPAGAVTVGPDTIVTLTVSDGSLAPKPTTSSAAPTTSGPTTGGGGG
jgi:serine/threonine-protein kinase